MTNHAATISAPIARTNIFRTEAVIGTTDDDKDIVLIESYWFGRFDFRFINYRDAAGDYWTVPAAVEAEILASL